MKATYPLYKKIKDDILSQIQNGSLHPGDRLPTEYELTQQYQVSRITVSKALNDLKTEGVIIRFPNKGSFVAQSALSGSGMAADHALGYTAGNAAGGSGTTNHTSVIASGGGSNMVNHASGIVSGNAPGGSSGTARGPSPHAGSAFPAVSGAQSGASPETAAAGSRIQIACILPTIADQFALSLVNGVLSVFPEDQYVCHIFQSRNPETENYLLQLCLDTQIAGLVLFPRDQPFFSDQLMLMQLQKYPFVLLDRYLPRLNTSYVTEDNQTAGALCLRHLHALGHRRFAFVTSSGKDTVSIKHRLIGITRELLSFGLPDTALQIIEHLDKSKAPAYHRELFTRLICQEKVTAFISAESTTCAYLYEMFTAMQLQIPGDISLISFDKPLTNHQLPDFFTHIDQSEFQMGRDAGLILKRQIENQDTQVYQKVIPPRLEICRSTGPVKV